MAEMQLALIRAVQSSTIPRRDLDVLAMRERATDKYWSHHDPIHELRIWWRAQTARHIFHLLPGESILELGCGSGKLTRALLKVTRGECPITAATFEFPPDHKGLKSLQPDVEVIAMGGFPGELRGRKFDYVVGTNLLDLNNTAGVLNEVQKLLRPGGRLLFFETNPWNPVFQLRRVAGKYFSVLLRGDERALANRIQLYELISELGFVRIVATPY